MTDERARGPESQDRPWPSGELEHVRACPACGADSRRLLHEGLVDRVFGAPGRWNLYECQSCRSAYLDPRPSERTIHLAYERYYTHELTNARSSEELNLIHRWRRALANGYRNWRFGTNLQPASYLGVILAWMLPRLRTAIDHEYRHLPRHAGGRRVLDVGSGNGGFLVRARSAGWQVVGVDPDPQAMELARSMGLDVRAGGIEVLQEEEGKFDVVTMSHVIEHVPQPAAVLQQVYRLLKPGGMLWLETPNIASVGHRRYGASWRGLEPPRHLVLFNWPSITRLLGDVGFRSIRRLSQRNNYSSMASKSAAISQGRDPYVEGTAFRHRVYGVVATVYSKARPGTSEFITLIARKPDASR